MRLGFGLRRKEPERQRGCLFIQTVGGVLLTCGPIPCPRRAQGFTAHMLVENEEWFCPLHLTSQGTWDSCWSEAPHPPTAHSGCCLGTKGGPCLPKSPSACPRPCPHLCCAASPSVGVFLSFRRKWAFPVNCWNQTSSNAAWDSLS